VGTAGQFVASGTSGHCGGSPLYAIAALYNAGPVDLTVAYENLHSYSVNSVANIFSAPVITRSKSGASDVWTLGGSYDFGVAKVMGNYNFLEGAVHGWQIGVLAPVSSQTTAKLSYNNSDKYGGGNKNSCSKIAAGVNYDLSKRTRVYADVAHLIDDDAGGACASGLTTGSGGLYASSNGGRDDGNGYGRTGMNVGIRHSF
jgi:predicted porin